MQDLLTDNTELYKVITNTLTAFSDSIKVIVRSISDETSATIKLASQVVSLNIVDLIDKIFDFYSDEWPIVNQNIIALNDYINTILYNQTVRIDKTLNNFTELTNTLVQRYSEQLDLIDKEISDKYNERMFVIYGRIAEVSVAINTPPFYIEGLIQNAKSFAMAVSCSVGLSYYQFQSNWDDGINRLLIRIGNSISLYQQNPQWIKVDIENSLIKPLFEFAANKRTKEKQQINNLSNNIIDLQQLTAIYKIELDETKERIANLFELEIAPVLKEITESFDVWQQDIYDKKMQVVDKSFVQLFKDIVAAGYEIAKIIALLDLPADILLRVNKLSDAIRFDQEAKFGEVTTRDFRRSVPLWSSVVKEGIE